MDQLVREFAEKTPIHLLEKHRQYMRSIGDLICNTLPKLILDTVPGMHSQCSSQPWGYYFMSGSMAEGAAFARLFSPDSNTSGEFEIDIMIPVMDCVPEECLMYIEDNKAFAHILVDVGVWRKASLLCGEDTAHVIFCQKEDRVYMSTQLLRVMFRRVMEHSPNFFNNIGFRPSIAEKKDEDGSAAITIHIDDTDELAGQRVNDACAADAGDMGFASRQAQINEDASAKHVNLMKDVIPILEQSEIRTTEMLTRLQEVQDEFVAMRLDELSVSIHRQASKALEWAMLCTEIMHAIYDTIQLSGCRLFSDTLNVNCQTYVEEMREKCMQKLSVYINQLAVSEDDLRTTSDAAAVHQLLSDIERNDIAPNRFLLGFRQIVRQHAWAYKGMKYFSDNPQEGLWQIPKPLQQLADSCSRNSMDLVPCLKLTFWPSVAEEWKTRDRLWPDQSVIDELVSHGVHLVSKAFCHNDIDWRLSFSVTEIELATRWTPAQHFVYFVFKSLFYKFIKPLSSDSAASASPSHGSKYLATYMAKTVMMWTGEAFDQSWWREDNAVECLTVLLLCLKSAFECRTLDHYFVSSVNLLDGLPDLLAARVIDTINSILADPADKVGQLKSHFQKTEIHFNALPVQMEYVKCLPDFMRMFLASSTFPM